MLTKSQAIRAARRHYGKLSHWEACILVRAAEDYNGRRFTVASCTRWAT